MCPQSRDLPVNVAHSPSRLVRSSPPSVPRVDRFAATLEGRRKTLACRCMRMGWQSLRPKPGACRSAMWISAAGPLAEALSLGVDANKCPAFGVAVLLTGISRATGSDVARDRWAGQNLDGLPIGSRVSGRCRGRTADANRRVERVPQAKKAGRWVSLLKPVRQRRPEFVALAPFNLSASAGIPSSRSWPRPAALDRALRAPRLPLHWPSVAHH